MTVHGAGGNQRYDVHRHGYTVRYLGDDAWYNTRPGTSKTLWTDLLKDGEPIESENYRLVWEK